MRDTFQVFIDAVVPLIDHRNRPEETALAIEPHMKSLVSDPGWLAADCRRPIPAQAYAQYLLFRPPDYSFSVVSFVWNPSQGSPIHDHCTWGVIGQYEGEEDEERFRLCESGLESLGITRARPGDVAHVYPPQRDIHPITNRSDVPTISIHIYGGDIGSQSRHIYDPLTGRTRPFVSGYDPR